MKHLVLLIWLIFPSLGFSQALQNINFAYLYDPAGVVSFEMKPVLMGDEWHVLFALKLNESAAATEDITISWEKRKSLSDKEGIPLETGDDDLVIQTAGRTKTGVLTLPYTGETEILVAKLLSQEKRQLWYFYKFLPADYPLNGYLVDDSGQPTLKNYLVTDQSIGFKSGAPGPLTATRYDHSFPAAAPSFSEAQARVSAGLQVDSTFAVTGASIRSGTAGLYLLQQDTAAAKGFAFRVYDDYPRYKYLENLIGPLIYVCTRQEYARLEGAGGDKKIVDRVILGITGDTERAKLFMRGYFRRVEWANERFHSYKEGWKTDRGMTFVIFGLPNEVFLFEDREVWNYDNGTIKVSFDFVRSSTLFDPENYVLIRKQKYQETWYQVIDLLRNARF